MRGDFHIHTISSDGSLTSEQILKYVEGKCDYISITDHDIIVSSIEAFNLADKYNVKCIIGVEISSYNNDENVHVLGYFKNDKYLDSMKDELTEIRNSRLKRLYIIKERLLQYFDIDLDITELLKRPTITRGSIAREIIKQYPKYTVEELFTNVIGQNCKAYYPSTKISTSKAIELIHKCNGLAVLAHPTLLRVNKAIDIVKLGIDGIEARYSQNKENDEMMFRQLAKENGLFVTSGTDFHYFNDTRHGDLLSLFLDGDDLSIFVEKIKNL